ncbi:MAG: ribonuclease D [Gammaproteobacteria bacterium]|nr:ribonuclease D [Gammaproteobacteria bacterium]
MTTRPWEIIKTPAELDDALDRLEGSHFLALDTEFIRERTYQSHLCLVQLADENSIFLLDALALPSLDPLARHLANPAVTTVVHSARQDLEILFQVSAQLPAKLFDTQVAAVLLGHGDQVAYSALVRDYCEVELDKSSTRTDWSKRPLDMRQLDYAADDVRYLTHLFLALEKALVACERIAWMEEDCRALCEPGLYAADPWQAHLRIKGGRNLTGDSRRVLRWIAAWREEQAIRRDLPRQWILKDAGLLQIANHQAHNRIQLAQLSEVPETFIDRFGSEIVEAVGKAREAPPDAQDEASPSGPPTAQEKAMLNRLRKILNERAEAVGIASGFLAPRRDLEQLARGQLQVPATRGWRREIIGIPLLEALTPR